MMLDASVVYAAIMLGVTPLQLNCSSIRLSVTSHSMKMAKPWIKECHSIVQGLLFSDAKHLSIGAI